MNKAYSWYPRVGEGFYILDKSKKCGYSRHIHADTRESKELLRDNRFMKSEQVIQALRNRTDWWWQ